MRTLEDTLNIVIVEYEQAFKKNIQALDEEIIRDSPVRWGGFKTGWQLEEFDPKNFRYRRVNNSVYGMKLWRYHHSLQGWSPTTGDNVVLRHSNNLRRDFEKINRSLFTNS